MANPYERHINPETEQEILRLFSEGKRSKEIAYELGLKVWTVYRMAASLPLFTKALPRS